MNKLTYTTLLLLSSIVAFAQEDRPSRASRASDFSDSGFSNNQNIEPLADPGTNPVPIDNYQFLLIGLAVLLIAYFVYRSRQVQKA